MTDAAHPNLFQSPPGLPRPEEFFETLARHEGVTIERIISHGHATPKGEWFDQERDEWVALLQGRAIISYDDGTQQSLDAGDWLVVPAHRKHRVELTSSDPPCIWLAIHLPPHSTRGPNVTIDDSAVHKHRS